jgi:hypothetical protein
MATPKTRIEFKKYCLRELGAPVIEINVDEDQVDDRIDDALEYYRDFHYDGMEHDYYKILVTSDDIDNKYITLPDTINGVVGILPIGSSIASGNMFNLKYQMAMSDIHNWSNGSFANYTMSMERIALMQELFVGKQLVRYNRHTNRLYIDMDWKTNVSADQYVIIECYKTVDPSAYADVWGDRWLRKYATQLIKRQWGTNMKKFTGMQLPGGVQFNGEQIYQEAEEEIKRLEEEMVNTYSLPTYDLMG